MENSVTLKFKKLHPDAIIPKQAHPGDAGFDLHALQDATLYPESRLLVKTGLAMQLPVGYEGQVRSRSGAALKNGCFVLNSPGTIDCSYTGEVGVILHNTSDLIVPIKAGDRVAQLVINKLPEVRIEVVDELDGSSRGNGGFGSTGI